MTCESPARLPQRSMFGCLWGFTLQLIHAGGLRFARMISGFFTTESLILAQNERWRRGLGMQVERERGEQSPLVEWRTGE